MKFSLFHLPSFFPEFHASEAQFYQDMLLETDRADALGFHSVWFAEHHFYNYGGHIPSIPVLGSAVGVGAVVATGVGVPLTPTRTPTNPCEESVTDWLWENSMVAHPTTE